MSTADVDRLRSIKTFPSLVKYLRDELDWPIETNSFDELYFEYKAEELGLDPKKAVDIKEIRQLRPLTTGQPWGIFWINFEKKRLPMTVMRRILGNLVKKSRRGAGKPNQPTWQLHDLLFISSYGEEEHRNIAFAHFGEVPETDELPVLRVLGWDDQNSIMHLDRVAHRLSSYLKWPDSSDDVEGWRERWSEAFTDRYREAIRSADVLIPRLAQLAANTRKRVRDTLDHETERGPMRKLFAAVRELLIHDMSEDQFADMYAQTVAYGLLSTSFSRRADITPQNLVQLTAVSNPFLENLLENLFRLNRGKFHFDVDEVGINDVLELLRNTNIDSIKAAFSDENPAEDPVIRFYEGFLKEYDPEQRLKRGVFFTPRPVVSYIVRSVHELLQSEFGLEDGLASTFTWSDMRKKYPDLKLPPDTKPDDPFVCILDPATGTGTFLFTCIEVIERTMKDKWCRELGKKSWRDPEILARWREYVPRHLFPRLYGYELMMAPYAIAHLKLALKLGETGYQFGDGDRLHIYLTNSLEPPSDVADSKLASLFATLAREAQEVNDIKRHKRFTVVVGNPPYANYSANLSPQARRIVDKYRNFRGVSIRERNQLQFERNIQDDFVKFISIAQDIVGASGVGVFSYITNGTMLASTSLRGMRENLVREFSSLFELNLHGGGNEIIVGAEDDENVFDIVQSVAIHVYVRSKPGGASEVSYADLLGRCPLKYAALASQSVTGTEWRRIQPDLQNCGFTPQDEAGGEASRRLDSAFVKFGAGIKTNRDIVVIGFDDASLLEAVREFDGKLASGKHAQSNIHSLLYRPFDVRRIFYHEDVVASRSLPTMKHVVAGPNIGFVCSSTWTTPDRFSVGISRLMVEMKTGTHDRGTTFFPLYRYESLLGGKVEQVHNITPEFVKEWCASTQTRFVPTGHGDGEKTTGPEDVLFWLYGLFYSPEYRRRYRAALSQRFPIVLLTSNLELFRVLARLGGELVALHLMESRKLDKHITEFVGGRNPAVEKVSYTRKTVWVDKAQTAGFKGVPEQVWNFHVGGYQVCEKWLKYRKGRTLSKDDIEHYHRIVVALNETFQLMAEIDNVIDAHGGWPGAFSSQNREK